LPTTAITSIPFAHVTGNSVDGSFVFGGFSAGNVINVDLSDFLNLQIDVTSQIDPSNATDDVFSVDLDVAGLNDTGVLAASVASGVQSLVNSQIGTWRQRMGVLPEKGANDAGLSPWFRWFTDKGEVDPAHLAANFLQGGNFAYDQSNSGEEVGMNVNPGARGFNFGLLLNKSEGSQHLVNPGVGSDRISSNAVGLYGTWISPNGWYLDLSHRWITFDAVLGSAGGEQRTKGDASAWNVEAGYDAWTLSGGMKITPQVQYTRTRIGNIDDVHGDSATFAANGGDSSRGRLGVAFSMSINGNSGFFWTPYGSVNAVREFNGITNYTINNVFSGSTSVEGTSAMVELGLGAQKGGFSITGGVNWTDGGALQSFTGGQLELRYSW
jgi:outer membrane autotransporter protein